MEFSKNIYLGHAEEINEDLIRLSFDLIKLKELLSSGELDKWPMIKIKKDIVFVNFILRKKKVENYWGTHSIKLDNWIPSHFRD